MKATFQRTALQIDPERTVGELAQSVPGAARTFEQLGIDYCCRGRQSLSEAAAQTSIPLVDVVTRLALADEALPPIPREPDQLCEYIVRHHHTFTREALQRLTPLADKLLRVHEAARPELRRVRQLLEALACDLEPHMMKEEQILFPYIAALSAGQLPTAPFGRIEQPLRVMQLEHDQVGALLRELDELTFGYCPPAGACASFAVFYAGLEDLQADLHEHIHLENNVLFPAALALKKQLDAQPAHAAGTPRPARDL
jgi:regulator of cell morphogenesis and NO signaling